MINTKAAYEAIGRRAGVAQFHRSTSELDLANGRFNSMASCESAQDREEARRIFQAARISEVTRLGQAPRANPSAARVAC